VKAAGSVMAALSGDRLEKALKDGKIALPAVALAARGGTNRPQSCNLLAAGAGEASDRINAVPNEVAQTPEGEDGGKTFHHRASSSRRTRDAGSSPSFQSGVD
jgi:hypothetical protein